MLYNDGNKVKSRANTVKEISDKLNANYLFGAKSIKNKFSFDISESYINDSNVIYGSIEGFDYCFIEYYYVNAFERGNSKERWISRLILKFKDEEFPTFHLITKKKALSDIIYSVILSLVFFIIPIIFYLSDGNNDIKLLLFLLAIFGVPFILTVGFIIHSLMMISDQDRFRISNQKFKEKYVLLDVLSSNNSINSLFSEEVCSNIVNYPDDIDIKVKKNSISEEFGFNETLSFEICQKRLNKLISIVKLFEN